MTRLIIFANGHLPDLESARRLIQNGDILIAADGGTQHVLALGLLPSIVIGDLDSLGLAEKVRLEAGKVEFRQFPREKDQVDLELALEYALEAGFKDMLIIGALGGRLDQTLGNLSILMDVRFSNCTIRFDDGVEEVFFVRSQSEIHGRPGEIVSLIPWGEDVTGVQTEGLRWPLRDEALFPDKTRGISNELINTNASISIRSGLLLVTHIRKIAP